MSCWALVPVKAAACGKSRLAGALSPDQRRRLVRCMLSDVLIALGRAQTIDSVAVMTPEPRLVDAPVLCLDDPGNGLNAALSHVAMRLAGLGATELVVIHGDVPKVTGADIDALVTAGRRTGLALAPDRHGLGTNALFVGLSGGFEFRFGEHSLMLHQQQARLQRLSPTLVVRPGLAFDVDRPEELQQLLRCGGERYAFINQLVGQCHEYQ